MKERRILVADDDPGIAGTLVDIFRLKKYQADGVYSAAEALQKVMENHYDCILSDVKMPGMNGIELSRAIIEILPEITVVLMTAYATDEQVMAARREGVFKVLTKPLDIDELLDYIACHLGVSEV